MSFTRIASLVEISVICQQCSTAWIVPVRQFFLLLCNDTWYCGGKKDKREIHTLSYQQNPTIPSWDGSSMNGQNNILASFAKQMMMMMVL